MEGNTTHYRFRYKTHGISLSESVGLMGLADQCLLGNIGKALSATILLFFLNLFALDLIKNYRNVANIKSFVYNMFC